MNSTKLKPDYLPVITGIIIALLVITFTSYIKLTTDKETTNLIVGSVWAIFACIQIFFWLRTSNNGFVVFMFFCILVSASYFTDYKGVFFIIPISLLLVIYLVFLVRKKYTFRYRNILELVAKPVNDASDGFTPRPLPVGKSKYTKYDLIGFGKYLSKNLIAFPYLDENGLILVINSSGKFWFQKPKLSKDTYIAFDYNGNVSVNIAQKDYNRYNEELTFDQLCTSLGNLFKRFLTYYTNGEKSKILAELTL